MKVDILGVDILRPTVSESCRILTLVYHGNLSLHIQRVDILGVDIL